MGYLLIQSRARIKKSLWSWCSSLKIEHCSRVTDMDVLSLALLQQVKRIPFSLRQICNTDIRTVYCSSVDDSKVSDSSKHFLSKHTKFMLFYDSQLVRSASVNEKHYLFISKASGTDWICLALCIWCVRCGAVAALWDGKYQQRQQCALRGGLSCGGWQE